tara:strand:+ start:3455 stop:3940 length:486 start_codon:yes stop_codon:yes gene_type:complete
MSDLTVTIRESIILPNGNPQVSENIKTISGVNQIARRIDTVTTSFEGTGIELIRFVDSESKQTAGSFVKDTVKYIRITNLDTDNFCDLYLIDSEESFTKFKLDPGKTIMFSNEDFVASSNGDYVAADYVDSAYYTSFKNLDIIKAKADTANINLEYLIASS